MNISDSRRKFLAFAGLEPDEKMQEEIRETFQKRVLETEPAVFPGAEAEIHLAEFIERSRNAAQKLPPKAVNVFHVVDIAHEVPVHALRTPEPVVHALHMVNRMVEVYGFCGIQKFRMHG